MPSLRLRTPSNLRPVAAAKAASEAVRSVSKFAANPRSVLYACVVARDEAGDVVKKAVDAFRKRAVQWERLVSPIPYVLPLDLARTLRACHRLLGSAHDLATIVTLVR